MKIEDEFRVAVPVEVAWGVLLDVERIAPCMPGAQLQEVEGDEYRGIVKVKVGPITAQYKGAARIVEADEAGRRVVINAEGRDTRGQGNASANVTATLVAEGDGTLVKIDTDLNVTGKVAQFGRGVMADVSSKLLGQFATCLQAMVLADDAAPAAATDTPASSAAASTPATPASPSGTSENGGVRTINSPEAQPVDLLDATSDALVKRVVPIVAALVALLAFRSLFKRRKRRKHRSGD
ncbi:MAG TPA: SRPBCC family protein [Acidimicrobiia bacterium]|nr:SRPBCC family protein [Acidimicrobiia bacterium]